MIALHPEDWAEVIGHDLADFVGAGGAMVRFVVGQSSMDIAHARLALKALAEESNLHFFDVDGAVTRLQYPNEILAAVASQIDFRQLMKSFLLQAVIEEGYEIPASAEGLLLRDIATLNDLVSTEVHAIVNDRIRSGIMKDRRLVRDVRYALWAIARSVFQLGSTDSDVPKRWLCSEVPTIRELRDFGIMQKVNRYNARGILRSVLTWLAASESNGSILFVNALRLAVSQNPRDGGAFYTRLALADVYEVMREFIDETDHMNNVLLVFAMPHEFLSIDPRGRGMGTYQALQFRVTGFPEATNPNPLSNMVLLSAGAQRRSFSA